MCDFTLRVEKANFHTGGTALRGEAMTTSDRCALKPKKDNFGRKHDPVRWVMSGGSPVTLAQAVDRESTLTQNSEHSRLGGKEKTSAASSTNQNKTGRATTR
jgi:hypothetical protein